LLTSLFSASIDDKNTFITKAVLQKALADPKTFVETKKKSSAAADNMYTGHLLLALQRMKEPEKAKPTIHAAIPPGAPIGCEED
jgi:hypothetical protein